MKLNYAQQVSEILPNACTEKSTSVEEINVWIILKGV